MNSHTEEEFVKIWNIAYKHVSKNPEIYSKISPELQSEIHLALLALQLEPKNYEFIPEQLKTNEKLSQKAITSSIQNFNFLPQSLKNNQNFIMNCLLENNFLLTVLPKEILTESFIKEISNKNNSLKDLIEKKLSRLNKT